MKYIMFEDFSGAPVPIIFPNRINFDEMREQMPYTRPCPQATSPTARKGSAATANQRNSNSKPTPTTPIS